VAFGLVDCTVCTTDVLVGGPAKAVVWLVVVCCIEIIATELLIA
jgi:hypothetical protein